MNKYICIYLNIYPDMPPDNYIRLCEFVMVRYVVWQKYDVTEDWNTNVIAPQYNIKPKLILQTISFRGFLNF